MFFKEILRKRVFLWWIFDGENMVECVVTVVFWQSLFRGGKMRQVLGFISRASRFRNSGFVAKGRLVPITCPRPDPRGARRGLTLPALRRWTESHGSCFHTNTTHAMRQHEMGHPRLWVGVMYGPPAVLGYSPDGSGGSICHRIEN